MCVLLRSKVRLGLHSIESAAKTIFMHLAGTDTVRICSHRPCSSSRSHPPNVEGGSNASRDVFRDNALPRSSQKSPR